MSREAMQMALEALENAGEAVYARGGIAAVGSLNIAAQALRQALKTKYEQARSLTDELMDCVDRLGSEADTVDPRVWHHLLVYAPKKEWVGLTDEEIEKVEDEYIGVDYRIPAGCAWNFAKDIEAKLKEKNHG